MPEPNLATPFIENHAFIIGINDYRNGISPLETAVNDAREIASLLGGDFHGYTTHLLENGTKSEMEAMFTQMKAKIKAEHRVIFYFAGHGIALDTDEAEPKGYLVPSDANGQDRSTLVPMDALGATLKELDDQDLHVHVLLILDCCFSGAFKWASGTRSFTFDENDILYEERLLRFTKHRACQVITSASHDQKAADVLPTDFGTRDTGGIGDKDNSPFAWALIQALLEGKADVERENLKTGKKESDGVITATELSAYLRDTVEPLTREEGTGQSPSFFPLKQHDSKGEFIFLNPKSKLNLPSAPDYNPYLGLRVFGENDVKHFFGRDAAIAEIEASLQGTSLLVVSASSGLGKSSTVKAGLFPKLKAAGKFQHMHCIRPTDGTKPLKDLPKALKEAGKHLIVIDQLEELFHLEEDARAEFEQQLIKTSAGIKRSTAKMLLTMRSDFEWHLRDSDFGKTFWDEEKIREFLYRLPPMKREELEQIMLKPADMIAYDFESEQMIDQILEEIDNAPGALPLLSFTLSKLYEFRDTDNRIFRLKDYTEKLGGINGALSATADQVFASFEPQEGKGAVNETNRLQGKQAILRNLFLRMVRLNDGSYTRRRVYLNKSSKILKHKALNELDYPDHLDEMVEEVLEAIGGGQEEAKVGKPMLAQLVIRGQDNQGPFIEPLHDSLLNFWGKGLGWIREFGREHLVLQRQLWQAVEEYHAFDEEKRKSQSSYRSNELGDTSPLWHNNPKLELVMMAICDPNNEWLCKQGYSKIDLSTVAWLLWEHQPDQSQLDTLQPFRVDLKEDNLELLYDKIKSQMDPWLNEFELDFVKKSFEKQQSELDRMREERDEARAAALAAKARELGNRNPTLALNLAFGGLSSYRSAESVAAFHDVDLLTYCHGAFSKSFEGHTGGVVALAYTPNGKQIVTGSGDKTAKLWDITTGTEIRRFEGHTSGITSLAISPDGKHLLTGSRDSLLKLWDIKTGEEVKCFEGHESSIYSVTFSPDGQMALSGSLDSKAKLWDIKTEKEIKSFDKHLDYVQAVAFSPDGTKILTGSKDKLARLWDIQTGKELKSFKGHEDGIYAVAFAPDGKQILTSSWDATAKLWDIGTENEIKSFVGHTAKLTSGVFSPNGKCILTASWDKEARLWDIESGNTILSFKGHTDTIYDAIFSPNGKEILTASWDKTAKLWQLPEDKVLKNFEGHEDEIHAVAFSQDHVLTGSKDKSAKLWELSSGKELQSFHGHKAQVYSVAFSPDHQKVLTASRDKSAKTWDLKTGKKIQSFEGHSDFVYAAVFSPDSKQILTCSKDMTAKLWDKSTGKEIRSFEGHEDRVYAVAFSPNGKMILTGSWDDTAKLWDAASGKEIQCFEGHDGKIQAVAFSPDGKHALTGSLDNSAKLWDIKNGTEVKHFHGHSDDVYAVAFSPDGQQILTGSKDKSAKLWDVTTGQAIKSYLGHGYYVDAVAFSPDGKFVLTGSRDKTAKIWSTSTDWNPQVYKLNEEERKEFKIPEEVEY